MKTSNRILNSSPIVVVGLLLVGCDLPDPETIRQRQHLPEPGFVADSSKGEALFNTNCIKCHGVGALGTNQGPPLVDEVYRPGHHADLTFHWAVKDGTRQHHWQFGDMPPVPHLTPEDVGHIIAYVRAEQRRAGIH